jgi:pyruvate kinase
MTEKDIADAIFAIEQKVDWIALFVKNTSRFKRPTKSNCRTFRL